MLKHPQVLADFGHDKQVLVDEGLKEVLELLNQHGYMTIMSCQDLEGEVWIQFDRIRSYEKMLQEALAYQQKMARQLKSKAGDRKLTREEKIPLKNTLWNLLAFNSSSGLIPRHSMSMLVLHASIKFDKSELDKFEQGLRDVINQD